MFTTIPRYLQIKWLLNYYEFEILDIVMLLILDNKYICLCDLQNVAKHVALIILLIQIDYVSSKAKFVRINIEIRFKTKG